MPEVVKSQVQQSLEAILPIFEGLPTQSDRETFIVLLFDKMATLGELSPERAHEIGEVLVDLIHRPASREQREQNGS